MSNGMKMCVNCKYLKDGKYCDRKKSDIYNPKIFCGYWKQKPKPANGDVIRRMNTSELIDVIVCPYPDKVCIHRLMDGYACKCCKRDWLNAPAEREAKDE